MKNLPMQVSSDYWFRIITYYQNLLMDQFLHTPLTPVAQRQIRHCFNNLVNVSKSRETHPAWHVPLELVFELSTQSINIVPVDPESIMFT